MNDEKMYVSRRSKTEIQTYEGRSLRTAGLHGEHFSRRIPMLLKLKYFDKEK
jgi:hypothetical protein